MTSEIPKFEGARLSIGVNDFVKRQTAASEFTHYEGEWEQVAWMALRNFDRAKAGYRDGVVLVPVPAEGFFCGIVRLKEGDKLVGHYKARRPGEEPRKTIRAECFDVGGSKQPCKHVDVVLYRRDVLESNGEDCTGFDWDIVSINGRLTDEEAPIEPMTLIANHFRLDGGTPTGMSPADFEDALRKSVLYWKDKAILESR